MGAVAPQLAENMVQALDWEAAWVMVDKGAGRGAGMRNGYGMGAGKRYEQVDTPL